LSVHALLVFPHAQAHNQVPFKFLCVHVFEKGHTPNWTTKIFRTRNVQNTSPTTYLLDDLKGDPVQGGFYEQDIKKTKFHNTYLVEMILKQKDDYVLVRWLGFSKSEDSWTHKNEIL